MGTKAGLLDRRIVIESFTSSQGSSGEEAKTWSTFATVWADLIPQTGTEQVEADRKTEKVDFKVRIRYLANLNETMRILYESKYYDISSMNELGRRDGWELFIMLRKNV